MVDSVQTLNNKLFSIIRSDIGSSAAASRIRSVLKKYGITGEALHARLEANTMPWFRDLVRYDPRPTLKKIDVPTLACFGNKDLFVPPSQNTKPMRSALSGSPSHDISVQIFEDLNHWLQPASTGLPGEIPQIKTTIATKVLRELTKWISRQTSDKE